MKAWLTPTRWLWLLLFALVMALQVWEASTRVSQPEFNPEQSMLFDTLRHARLVEDVGNDGDSFKLAHEGGEHVFRLHFVDCPEKKSYPLVAGRLKDQAAYFGGLSVTQTVNVGLEAKAFTEKLLRERRFQLMTRWERVFDSQRFYALVLFEDHEDLAEKLVKAGFARIYTKGVRMPSGVDEFDYERHLRDLEKVAKTTKVGAWGKSKRAVPKTTTK